MLIHNIDSTLTLNYFQRYFLTFHVCFHTFVQTVDDTGDSINEIYDVSYMFWRSFNLTFKANLFDEILMQPQKKLFFGFLFRALSGKLG